MKGCPVDQLVYEQIFPKPRTTDPQNFHTLLHRNLIPEVRQEVNHFYGHLDTQEAKYPGLDYTHRVHRIRLGRFPWHRRLFRAFDNLRLTDAEIASLTKWEGTKWAKERFERDSGITIRDTAFDEIGKYIEPEDRPQAVRAPPREAAQYLDEAAATADEEMDGEEDSDGELTSVGVALNEQLRERAARHEAGDTSLPLDEEWEQWLKNAIESGELPFLTDQIVHQSNNVTLIPQSLFPPRMLSAARSGQWDDIPDFLHGILRYALENEAPAGNEEASTPAPAPAPAQPPRRTNHLDGWPSLDDWRSGSHMSGLSASRRRDYSDLRLPAREANATGSSGVRLQRTAQSGA